MRNRSRWKTSVILSGLVLVIAIGGLSAIATVNARSNPAGPKHQAKQLNPNNNPFCSKLGKSVQASQGAQMFCFPPQPTGFAPATVNSPSSGNPYAPNVNAANPQEDVTPSGVSIHGQSETSIAAAGQYVVEAWNDGTGFFAPCGSPQSKDQLTGYGFSTDGGKSFRDMGGLPNNSCNSSVIAGDPSVEAYTVGGSTYFYISSIFIPFFVPENGMSITACQVVGSGSTATLACSQPIVAAISADCQSFYGFTFCSFLDKEFLSIAPARNRLYMTYTEFGPSPGFSGVGELAVCDLSPPASPTCHNGSTGSQAPPYLVVAPADRFFCENEGAYPAVDTGTGDVYVAYEHNWFSGLFDCGGETTQNVMNRIPFSCLTLPTAACVGPAASQAVNITSMEAAFIPGYNRFPMNDFPRVAVSGPAGTVSMVWNDARFKPSGDIILQSFNLGTLTPVQSFPVRVNNPSSGSGWTFLPAVRNAHGPGK